MYFEKSREGWDSMLEFLCEHPVCGYREARTKTWYPGQKLIYTPYISGNDDEHDGEAFEISGEKFNGARVEEVVGCLELHIDYDGDEVILTCDERNANLNTFEEVIDFLNSCTTIEGDTDEYAGLRIADGVITYEFTKYTYVPPRYETINAQNFESARIDYNRNEISIHAREYQHLTIKFEL